VGEGCGACFRVFGLWAAANQRARVVQMEKEALVGGKPQGPATTDQMLKATTELQNRAQASLVRTKKTIGETRDIGIEIVDTLGGQGEQIMRIDQGVAGVTDEAARANQILASIARRVATDKVCVVQWPTRTRALARADPHSVLCMAVLLTGVIVAVRSRRVRRANALRQVIVLTSTGAVSISGSSALLPLSARAKTKRR